MKNEEEQKAVAIMLDAAKDTEYLEDAMLLGYRALKEHKYPKPPEIDMSQVNTATLRREDVELLRHIRYAQERRESVARQVELFYSSNPYHLGSQRIF